jgi:TonB-linked SusC/RagA family outer membrane protein
MKCFKKKVHLLLWLFLLPMLSYAQTSITGTVLDATGETVIGANVMEKDTRNSVVTDVNGNFSLTVAENAVLQVFCLGYVTQEVAVGNRAQLQITLQESLQALDEVVVVGYGTQRKSTVTGAISSVNSEKLNVAPLTNLTTTLAGQLPGLGSMQSSGKPGADGATLRIRGFDSALIIVDGVESSMSHLDPSQVESITILKDGSASIYGARAGNGVILVTTKRGITSKPMITLNSSVTLQGSLRIYPALNAGQRAEWEREAALHAGTTPPYSETEVEKFYAGTDPNYQSYDWFDATIRRWAPQQNHNVTVRGGSEKIKYFGYFGYNKQETMVRNDGGDFTRYNLQSNVDAKITNRLTASADLSLIQRRDYFPVGSFNQYFWDVLYRTYAQYPLTLPDPDKLSWGGIEEGSALFMSSTKQLGYSDNKDTYIRATGSLNYDFKYVKGLSAKALFSYNYHGNWGKTFARQKDFYTYNWDTDTYTFMRKNNGITSEDIGSSLNSDFTQQYSLTYENVFHADHYVKALVLCEAINSFNHGFWTGRSGFETYTLEHMSGGDPTTATNSESISEMGRVSWIGRFNYGYKSRYLLEVILRADASAKFHSDHRWGYFPSVSLGWMISEESFMKKIPALDNMKLRASMGQTGYDNIGNFGYLSTYGYYGGYMTDGTLTSGLYSSGMSDENYTWERMSIYNAGLDFSFLKRKIYGTLEAFYRLRDNILGSRANSLPTTIGTSLPLENINSISTRGFEIQLGSAGSINDFSYDVSGNISWARSKYEKYDEPEYTDEDDIRLNKITSRWTDVRFGFIAEGLFTSQEEIDALPYTYGHLNGNASLRPGDVRYKDLNGDGVLNWRDRDVIGKGSFPQWSYGINISLRYKNFDCSMLFQGAFGYSSAVVVGNLKTSYAFEHRWSETNNDPNAIVPRLGSVVWGMSNNQVSTYNNHDVSYIRLKNASLGYELPKSILSKIKIEKVRVYIAGTNLLTFSTISKYGYDPEAVSGDAAGYYPQQCTLSAGINISF